MVMVHVSWLMAGGAVPSWAMGHEPWAIDHPESINQWIIRLYIMGISYTPKRKKSPSLEINKIGFLVSWFLSFLVYDFLVS